VNSEYVTLAERLVAGDPLTLQAILGDVMSQMITSLLAMEDYEVLLAHCEEGSIGAQARSWLEVVFPGQGSAAIRSMRNTAPGRFEAAILSAARVGDTA
jgi:hypothetical protein